MGTNYYLHEQTACPTCGHEMEPLHIGKSSCGWCFSLHVNGDLEIKSLQDWIARWSKEGTIIKNEYGETVTPQEMLSVILERGRETKDGSPFGYNSWDDFHNQNHSLDGPNGLLRHRIDGGHCLAHGDGTYDLMLGETAMEGNGE